MGKKMNLGHYCSVLLRSEEWPKVEKIHKIGCWERQHIHERKECCN